MNARPKLAAWLDALNEIPQLKTLTPSLGFPNCSPLSIRRRARHHTSLPYTLGYLGLSGGLWARTCSPRTSVSRLSVHRSPGEGGRRQRPEKHPSVCRATRPRTPRHPASAERAYPRRQDACRHLCVVRARPISALRWVTRLPCSLRLSLHAWRSSFIGNNWFPLDTLVGVLGAGDRGSFPIESLVTLNVQVFREPHDKQFRLRHSPTWPPAPARAACVLWRA